MHRTSDEPDGAEVSHNVGESPEAILAYWTAERMAEAVPREIRLPDPGGVQRRAEDD